MSVVVDTDCGSDDAMALLMALGGARAHRLLAITCCFGNTTVANVRQNVDRVLRVCGRTEIPVYSGRDHPLLRPCPDPLAVQSSVTVHGSDGFGDFPTEQPDVKKDDDFSTADETERPDVKKKDDDFLNAGQKGESKVKKDDDFPTEDETERTDVKKKNYDFPTAGVKGKSYVKKDDDFPTAFETERPDVKKGDDFPTADETKRSNFKKGDDFPTADEKGESDLEATEFLLRLSRDRPGEITIVALAPLTNLAHAHRADEEFTARLKEIVCLGGNYTGVGNVTKWAEFNFFSDPEAAHIVLSECKCPIRLVPWETCLLNGMEWDDFYAMLKTPGKKAELLRGATSIVSKFCEEEGDPAFLDCDVLAMAAALWPECVADTMTVGGMMGVVCEAERRGLCFIGGEMGGGSRIGVAQREGGVVEEIGKHGTSQKDHTKEKVVGVSCGLRGSVDEDGDSVLRKDGPKIEIVKSFHVTMLKELRKDMVAERPSDKKNFE